MSSQHYSLGLLGHPVAHSLSPILHNAALAHYKLDGDYRPIDVETANLKETLDRLEADGTRGLNVTIPHKQAVMPFLNELSEDVASIGAVNTIIFERNGETFMRRGENTDVHGFRTAFIEAYEERNLSLDAATAGDAILLGYGGAARAVVAGLKGLGFKTVKISGRNGPAIDSFCVEVRTPEFHVGPLVTFTGQSLSQVSTVINATPLGQHSEPIPAQVLDVLSMLPKNCFVYDLVYSKTNAATPLVENCQKLGLLACDGLGMLVHQAAKSFELWTGHLGPVEVMRAAVRIE